MHLGVKLALTPFSYACGNILGLHFFKTPKRTRNYTGKKIYNDFSVTTDDFNDYITSNETNDSYPNNNEIKLNVGDVFIFLVKLIATIVKYISKIYTPIQEEINLMKTETSHCERY